jgi:hypothetical protein
MYVVPLNFNGSSQMSQSQVQFLHIGLKITQITEFSASYFALSSIAKAILTMPSHLNHYQEVF